MASMFPEKKSLDGASGLSPKPVIKPVDKPAEPPKKPINE